ncbi:MAG: DUF4397 domain-containing protein [Myxococcota bacterium]
MINKTTLGIAVVAMLSFGMVGCGDDSDSGTGGTGGTATGGTGGGTGGTGGDGGAGGGELGGGTVTAVHLAPDVPAADNTAVAIFLDGEETELQISYTESSGRIELPAGTYDIGIGAPGGEEPVLQLDGVEIMDGSDLTVVAYRTNDPPPAVPVNVLVFNTSIEGLEAGSGRVFIGHGANDPDLDPVTVATVDDPVTTCTDVEADLAFGDIAPQMGGLDLAEGNLDVVFYTEDTCPPFFGNLIVDVPVTPNVSSVLIAVDEDPSDTLAFQLFGIIDADDPAPLIPPPAM